MAIQNSVGNKGKNTFLDVKVIQASLNLVNISTFSLTQKLDVDGMSGKKTVDAIVAFQKNVINLSTPDGRADPAGLTLKTLKELVTKGLSKDALIAIMGHGNQKKLHTYYPLLTPAFDKYQLTNPLRQAHFFAQVGHESLSFTYTEEIASGAAYEGREDLGNTQEGDGLRFKGRGLIQLTGRDNYDKYGKAVGVDFLTSGNESLIATDPTYALDVSLWFWQSRKLNELADKDDLRAITKRVNGGYNGLADRQAYLDRAKHFLI